MKSHHQFFNGVEFNILQAFLTMQALSYFSNVDKECKMSFIHSLSRQGKIKANQFVSRLMESLVVPE